MPAGDEKGLSKEILEQRRKIAEQSKKDKAEEKARLAKNWKEQKKKLNEMPPGMSTVSVTRFWHNARRLLKKGKHQNSGKWRN